MGHISTSRKLELVVSWINLQNVRQAWTFSAMVHFTPIGVNPLWTFRSNDFFTFHQAVPARFTTHLPLRDWIPGGRRAPKAEGCSRLPDIDIYDRALHNCKAPTPDMAFLLLKLCLIYGFLSWTSNTLRLLDRAIIPVFLGARAKTRWSSSH